MTALHNSNLSQLTLSSSKRVCAARSTRGITALPIGMLPAAAASRSALLPVATARLSSRLLKRFVPPEAIFRAYGFSAVDSTGVYVPVLVYLHDACVCVCATEPLAAQPIQAPCTSNHTWKAHRMGRDPSARVFQPLARHSPCIMDMGRLRPCSTASKHSTANSCCVLRRSTGHSYENRTSKRAQVSPLKQGSPCTSRPSITPD